jgi:hypothetical protein
MKAHSLFLAFGILGVASYALLASRPPQSEGKGPAPAGSNLHMKFPEAYSSKPAPPPVNRKGVVHPGDGKDEADERLRQAIARHLTGVNVIPPKRAANFAGVNPRVKIARWIGTILEAHEEADGWSASVKFHPDCENAVTLAATSVEKLRMANGVLTTQEVKLEGSPTDFIQD